LSPILRDLFVYAHTSHLYNLHSLTFDWLALVVWNPTRDHIFPVT